MAVEDDPPAGVPDWVLTFGDMMSLLLTFFILLVSMSELKQDDKFQGVADSLEEHFGHDSAKSDVPGESHPRNSTLSAMLVTGRSRRKSLLDNGVKDRGVKGDQPKVRMIHPGNRTAVGTVIFFEENVAELSEENRADLERIVERLEGKPQKIEVRGHTSRKPAEPSDQIRDNWDLAYQRARNTMRALSDEFQIDSKRIRMSVAGANEPLERSPDPKKLKDNPRVEVFLLEETTEDEFSGEADSLPGR